PGVQSIPSTVGTALFEPGAHFVSVNGGWLNASGPVTVNNATLDIVGSSPGSPWLVVKNLGTTPVTGTFLGLPEGAIIDENWISYRISYTGGDGNDIMLTRLAVPVTPTSTSLS